MKGKLIVITGYGAGLGASLKTTFERAGAQVIGISRHAGELSADMTQLEEVMEVFDKIIKQYGKVDIVIHNVARLSRGTFVDVDVTEFELSWRQNTLSAFNLIKAALPAMLNKKEGKLFFTGATASIRGSAGFGSFASAKFALRGMLQSLAREVQPKGIHVAHLVLDGILWSELSRQRFPSLSQEQAILPNDIAETYLMLANQKRSAWSHELDIRPSGENF
ncbi:MAG: NAD(P)-dependent dehydrogenase (short-subunit alcohol dehydrogenase family) [Shewanella sp.]|jgi:NAD(P)-dependent dehydrogenase (short-subunit alcohol dehydrogenase family)